MYRALLSFSGVISMARGEIREIQDEKIAKELLKSGYIESLEIMDIQPKETAQTKTTKTTKTKKK